MATFVPKERMHVNIAAAVNWPDFIPASSRVDPLSIKTRFWHVSRSGRGSPDDTLIVERHLDQAQGEGSGGFPLGHYLTYNLGDEHAILEDHFLAMRVIVVATTGAPSLY